MERIRANSYLIMDFETSGLIDSDFKKMYPKSKTDPNSKHFVITEFAGITIKGDDLSQINKYENLIKPYGENKHYSQIAAEITKITKEITVQHGVAVEEFMKDFTLLCEEANSYSGTRQKVVLVGHNLGFDIDFLQSVAEYCKVDLSKLVDGHRNWKGDFCPRYMDTERESIALWGANTNIKSYTLTKCCEKTGVDVTNAHRAMADVAVNTELFRYLVRRLRSGHVEAGKAEEDTIKARSRFQI